MRLVISGGSNVKIWFDLELRFAVAARIDNIESSKIYYLWSQFNMIFGLNSVENFNNSHIRILGELFAIIQQY